MKIFNIDEKNFHIFQTNNLKNFNKKFTKNQGFILCLENRKAAGGVKSNSNLKP